MALICGTFRVWHHTKHATVFGQDACDILFGSVRVIGIAKRDAVIAVQSIQRGVIGKIVAVMVGNRNVDNVAGIVAFGINGCLLYTSPSPRDLSTSRMPSSA